MYGKCESASLLIPPLIFIYHLLNELNRRLHEQSGSSTLMVLVENHKCDVKDD